jgi:hypothetical protein
VAGGGTGRGRARWRPPTRRTRWSCHGGCSRGCAARGVPATRADRLGAFQGLDLGLLIHAQHNRTVGWVKVQADDVVDLGDQLGVGGELEGLGPPGLDAVPAPDAGDGVAADAELAGQQPGRPVGDPQPRRRPVQGDRQDLGAAPPAHRLGPSRPGPVGQPAQAAADVPAAAGNDRWSSDADPLGDLGVGDASAARSRIRARWASTAGSWAERTHRRSSSRSSGAMGSGGAAGMPHPPISATS